MAADGWMRASDRDREEAVEILRQAYAEGRLDREELDERMEVAYQARTWGELHRVIDDLPRGSPRADRADLVVDESWQAGTHPGRPPLARPGLRLRLLMLILAIACAAIGAAFRCTPVIAIGVLAGSIAAIGNRC